MEKVIGKNFVVFKAHNILGVGDENFSDYIFNLGDTIDFKIYDIASLLFAIRLRALAFRNQGCRIVDKVLEPEIIKECNFDEADTIFKKALVNEKITVKEREKYGFYIMKYLEEIAEELNFVI